MLPDDSQIWFDGATGSLHLDFRFLPGGICFRIDSWANGLQAYQRHEGEWRKTDRVPKLRLFTDQFRQDDTSTPLAQFMGQIPAFAHRLAASYPCHTLTVYRMLRATPLAADVATHSPVLFWLLADHLQQQGWAPTRAAALIAMKRTAILHELGYEAAPYMVRFLAKIRLPSFEQEHLTSLRQTLARPEAIRRLGHQPCIDRLSLDMASHFPGLLQYRYIRNALALGIPRLSKLEKLRQLHQDTVRLGISLDIPDYDRAIARLTSLRELEELHDRWTERLLKQGESAKHDREKRLYNTPFPPLPCRAPEVLPITTFTELEEEGRAMHHCVASYAEAILAGTSYIYRVLKPQRGTLEIDPETWRIVQFHLACNKIPDAEARSAVRQWHSQAAKEAGSRLDARRPIPKNKNLHHK